MAAGVARAAARQGLSDGFVRGHFGRRASQTRRGLSAGLQELATTRVSNVTVEFRWADGRYERLPAFFDELVRRNVDVIVAHGAPGAACRQAGYHNDPHRNGDSGDAEASGLIASLSGLAGT